jgi:hypothetical protein
MELEFNNKKGTDMNLLKSLRSVAREMKKSKKILS